MLHTSAINFVSNALLHNASNIARLGVCNEKMALFS